MAKRNEDGNITVCEEVDPEDNMHGAGDYLLPKPTPVTSLSKPRCMSTWTFSLIVLSLSVLFLFGLLAGYYVWESMNNNDDKTTACSMKIEFDSASYGNIEGVHENVVYFLSGARVLDQVRNLKGLEREKSASEFDSYLSDKVKEEFEKFGLDRIEVQEHEIVVTYPDPSKPNRLEVLDQSSSVILNNTLENHDDSNTVKKSSKKKQRAYSARNPPYVAFSPAGIVEGPLLYGHYGRAVDFAVLESLHVDIRKRILLIRLGKIPVRDKLWLASQKGASGVLLYWDSFDHPSLSLSYIPTVSANPGSGDFDSLIDIPAQTISFRTADLLLKSLSGDQVVLHWPDQTRLKSPHFIGNSLSGRLNVSLHIHNKEKVETVRNVIGYINGHEQADESVIIGAQRHSSSTYLDNLSSTAMLLEIAHSLSHIQYREHWNPRRQIKLVSFGGLQNFSDAGIMLFIKSKPELLKITTVAYFSLDNLATGFHNVHVMSSPAFNDVILNVASKVVDVHNNGKTLLDTWMDLGLDNPFPITETDDSTFYDILGVPEFRTQYADRMFQNGHKQNEVSAINTEDEHHHYKYHIMAARVLTLTMLKLTDLRLTPFNMQKYTHSLYQTIQEFTSKIIGKERQKIVDLKLASERLLEAGKSFQDIVTRFMPRERMNHPGELNRITMAVNKIFIKKLPFIRSNINILSRKHNTTLFEDIINLQKTSNSSKTLLDFVQLVIKTFEETTEILDIKG